MSHKRVTAFVAVLVIVAAATSAWAQLPEIHYIKFNEGTGTAAADLALPGLGAMPTLNGNSTWQTANPRLGNACLEMGPLAGDLCRTNANFVINNDWTIEFWFLDLSPANDTSERNLIGDITAQNFKVYTGGSVPNGDLRMEMVGLTAFNLTNVFVPNTWTHIAYVHDSVGLTITPYVNGVAGAPVPQPAAIVFGGTSATGLQIGGYGSSPSWNGYIDEMRVWNQARSATDIMNNMNVELGNPPIDIQLSRVTSPMDQDCVNLGATEAVTVDLRNTGTSAITAGTVIPINYSVDMGVPVIENFMLPATLNFNDTTTYTFTTTVDLSTPGTYTIVANVMLSGDGDSSNDTAQTTVSSGGVATVQNFPYTETFDGSLPAPLNGTEIPPPGWEQDASNGANPSPNPDWIFNNLPTQTPGTGPPADHTTGLPNQGFFAYTEDAGNHMSVAVRSPCIDLSPLTSPTLAFWVYSNNAFPGNTMFENFLHVDVITFPSGTVTTDVIAPIGHLGNAWNIQVIDLSAFAGQIIKVRFRGESDGGSVTHDLAFDDVSVFEAQPTNGQAPQLGDATLDINSAINGQGFPVSLGMGGPYFGNVQVGDLLTYSFSGEQSQPVVIVFGPLNVGLFTFPNIGQLDIGTGLDPMTGAPQGLSVLVDGTNPTGLNPFFNTGPTGVADVFFSMPAFPPGILATFQAFVFNSSTVVKLTNAVQLTVF